MIAEKAAQLVYTVSERTKEGRVPWTSTAREDAFEASFAKQTLRIERESGRDADGDRYTLYFLSILDEDGVTIDTVYPGEIDRFFSRPNAWDITRDIFERAHDIALGVDENVNALFDELGGPVPLPSSSDDGGSFDDTIPF